MIQHIEASNWEDIINIFWHYMKYIHGNSNSDFNVPFHLRTFSMDYKARKQTSKKEFSANAKKMKCFKKYNF